MIKLIFFENYNDLNTGYWTNSENIKTKILTKEDRRHFTSKAELQAVENATVVCKKWYDFSLLIYFILGKEAGQILI